MLLSQAANHDHQEPDSKLNALKEELKKHLSTVNTFLVALPRVIKEIYAADSVSLWSHDPVNQRLIHVASAGIDTTQLKEFILDVREAPCGICVDQKRPEQNIDLHAGFLGRLDQHANLTRSLGHAWMTSMPILNIANPNQVLQVVNLMFKKKTVLSDSDLRELAGFCASRYERLLHEFCFRHSSLLQFELSANAISGDLRNTSRIVATRLLKCTSSEASVVFVHNVEYQLQPMGISGPIDMVRDSYQYFFQIAEETVAKNREKIELPEMKSNSKYSLVSVPIRDFGGRPVGAMVCLRHLSKKMAFTFDDVTVSESLGGVFAIFYELLASEEQRLSALERMDHELRGPVTGMKAAISFIRRQSGENSPIDRYLRDLISYTETMTDVLLNIEGATDQGMSEKLSRQRVHLVYDLIAPAMSAIKDSLISRGITDSDIRRPGLSQAPPMFLDKTRMMQVVLNLLENAVKYSDPSASFIKIDVTFKHRNGKFEISFRDWGIGVPEGYEERIFKMGVRAPNSIKVTATGKGYGLAISRKIVRAHGGDLIYRRHDVGSEFVIELPERIAKDSSGI